MLTEIASRRSDVLRKVVQAVDAAATPHGLDRYVELVWPTWSTREVRGRVTSVRRQTPNTVTLTIEPNHNWTGFRAGQYTQLTVEIDGVRHTRCYSIANDDVERRLIELTVKAHPGGVVSNFLVERARAGLVVGLSSSRGEFVLPDPRPDRILFMSGGSGITPVMSMLRTLCAGGHGGPVTFVHYCLTETELTYGPELAELAAGHPQLRVVRIFTDEPGRGDLDGFASSEQLDAIDPDWRSSEIYLCGPAPLMASMAQICDKAGVSERLHTEAFTLTHVVAEAPYAGGVVRFAATGSTTEVSSDGRSLLELAESAGLTPAYGCRMGICQTCTCPLADGAVRNLVTGEVTTSRGQPVRLCVSAAVGDVTIDL